MIYWMEHTVYGTVRTFIFVPDDDTYRFMSRISHWGGPDKNWQDAPWLIEGVVSWEHGQDQAREVRAHLENQGAVSSQHIIRRNEAVR